MTAHGISYAIVWYCVRNPVSQKIRRFAATNDAGREQIGVPTD
jgi:hypothetical protein